MSVNFFCLFFYDFALGNFPSVALPIFFSNRLIAYSVPKTPALLYFASLFINTCEETIGYTVLYHL